MTLFSLWLSLLVIHKIGPLAIASRRFFRPSFMQITSASGPHRDILRCRTNLVVIGAKRT
jgi:hypothetical protein